MGHKAQVVLDEFVAGREIALGPQVDVVFFLFGVERPGEGAEVAPEPEGQDGTAHEEQDQRGEYHTTTTFNKGIVCRAHLSRSFYGGTFFRLGPSKRESEERN